MEDIFYEVIKILGENKLNHNVIVIGSWAEYVYEKNKIISNFHSNIKTKDIDLLVENIHIPREKIDILERFTKNGFEITITGYDVYKLIKGDFEVEFLGEMKGGSYKHVAVPSLSIPKVEALTHVSMLFHDSIETAYKGITIRIPNPYCYIFHKMIINEIRKNKKLKDQLAIKNLLFYLDSTGDKSVFMNYFINILSKKEKASVIEYIMKNDLGYYFSGLLI